MSSKPKIAPSCNFLLIYTHVCLCTFYDYIIIFLMHEGIYFCHVALFVNKNSMCRKLLYIFLHPRATEETLVTKVLMMDCIYKSLRSTIHYYVPHFRLLYDFSYLFDFDSIYVNCVFLSNITTANITTLVYENR